MLNVQTDTHGIAAHANTAGDMQESISACPANSKPPDSPGSIRPCPGKMDGLKSCPGTQRVCIHVHSIQDGSRTPANALESPDLPVRGAVPCMGEPERPRDEMDMLDTQGNMGNWKSFVKLAHTTS